MQTGLSSFSADFRRVSCGCLAFVLMLWACAPARADDAHKLVLINEMFQVTHIDTMMQQTMKQVMDAQKAQFAKMDTTGANKAMSDELFTKVTQIVTDSMSWDKLKPDMTKLYADNFTEDELAASLAFYKTPAGQAILLKMPAVMTSSMAIVQQRMVALTPQIQQAAQEIAAKHKH